LVVAKVVSDCRGPQREEQNALVAKEVFRNSLSPAAYYAFECIAGSMYAASKDVAGWFSAVSFQLSVFSFELKQDGGDCSPPSLFVLCA
jgi:hypothetical protein